MIRCACCDSTEEWDTQTREAQIPLAPIQFFVWDDHRKEYHCSRCQESINQNLFYLELRAKEDKDELDNLLLDPSLDNSDDEESYNGI